MPHRHVTTHLRFSGPFPRCQITAQTTPDAEVSEASRSVREAAGPATNVRFAPNVRDTIPEDCSKRSRPEREVWRYATCLTVVVQT